MKKNVLITYSMILALFIQSCSIQGGFRKGDDGSAKLSQEDSLRIKKYAGQNLNDLKAGYYTVTSNDVKQMLLLHQYSWLMILASWCPHCSNDLPLKVTLTDSLSKEFDLILLPVFVNYNLEEIKRMNEKAKYSGPALILDREYFGNEEGIKHQKLVKDLFNVNSRTMVPHHIITNRNLEILHDECGEMHVTDSALQVFRQKK